LSQSAPTFKLGVYGGAFDPPHVAHAALAQAAIDQWGLDELRIIPTGQAWHKSRVLTPAVHRIVMARMAFEGIPQARIDEREVQRSGHSYTIDTLRELQTEHPQAQLFVLMGQDQWALFPQWHAYEDILKIATILVAIRAGSVRTDTEVDLKNHGKIKCNIIQLSPSSISATEIRQFCQHGQSMDHLVKPSVARYIERNRLYVSHPSLTESFHTSFSRMTTQKSSHITRRPAVQAIPDAQGKRDVTKLTKAIVDGLEDVKAQNLMVFDTEHLSSLFERVIVASGTSNRQTKALAMSVREAVSVAGFPKPRTEGEDNGEWIIVDCGPAVVHIMQPAIRQYYHLEDIWGEKPMRLKHAASEKEAEKAEKKAGAHFAAQIAKKKAGKTDKTSDAAKKTAAKPSVAAKKSLAKKAASKSSAQATAKKAVVSKAASGKPASAKLPVKAAVKTPAKAPPKAPVKKSAAKTAA
jgi:nicotinate (nicotinamide) nucleotide adenylyltransferase/ribosome silencing factor RsfS/YbeB/iojap